MICYRVEPGAIVLNVRLTPRARQDRIGTVSLQADGRAFAGIHVRAVPEDGAANRALVVLLGKAFRVAKSRIALVTGVTARLKQVRIEGNPPELAAVVESWPKEM